MSDEILAITEWPTNAALIADVARLGYLHEDWPTLDATYGKGAFWKVWRPKELIGYDLNPAKSMTGTSIDFRDMHWLRDGEFRAVVFDPPYKLNGTPTDEVDEAYGVDEVRTRDERHQLMIDGCRECARVVCPGGYLLVKCQDQVNSGRVWWQTDMMTRTAEECGLVKVDAFLYVAWRPQPSNRTRRGCPTCAGSVSKSSSGYRCRTHGVIEPVDVPSEQEHAYRNYSTLLVFQRPGKPPAQATLL